MKSCQFLFEFQIRTAVGIMEKKFKFINKYITKVQMLSQKCVFASVFPLLQRAYHGKMPSMCAITIKHIVRGSSRCSSARGLPIQSRSWDALPKLIFIYSLQLKLNNIWFSLCEVSLNQFLIKCFSLKFLKNHLKVLKEKAFLEERENCWRYQLPTSCFRAKCWQSF